MMRLGQKYGFDVDVIPAQFLERDIVSSTRIRNALRESGDVALAAKLLGRRYGLEGVVVHGAGRGTRIGYPTANIEVDNPQKVIPLTGVYAVLVYFDNNQPYKGMLNIGVGPTFGGTEERIEVHMFDFDKNVYNTSLRVEFVHRIRSEKKFNSATELIQQLSEDKERCMAELESVT